MVKASSPSSVSKIKKRLNPVTSTAATTTSTSSTKATIATPSVTKTTKPSKSTSISSSSASTVKKHSQNNKENQDHSTNLAENQLPVKSLANKIYKSRDGLAAVSSNTSIMSEVSNISKNSTNNLLQRQASISSSTSSVRQQQQQQPIQPGTKASLIIRQHTFSSETKPAVAKLATSSNLAKPSTPSGSTLARVGSHLTAASTPATNLNELRKATFHSELKMNPLRTKSGVNASSNSINSIQSSSHQTAKPTTGNAALGSSDGLLQITTTANSKAKQITPLSSISTTTSTTKNGLLANKNANAATVSNEIKLGREIKRLEALCESRTKELTMLKMKLRDTVFSFDAIIIAYNYLANTVSFLLDFILDFLSLFLSFKFI